MMLSILICTLPNREESFNTLLEELYYQKQGFDVEILTDNSPANVKSIGQKRNDLVDRVTGRYFCFIDDDDMVSKDYVKEVVQGCESGSDCLSLKGVITWNGSSPELFEHSIRYSQYKTTDNVIKFERYPNHLNCIKSWIGKCFKFPDINHGEDTDWATQIYKSGLIKTEYYIDKVLYNYQYNPNK